jgi:hypothetical protein
MFFDSPVLSSSCLLAASVQFLRKKTRTANSDEVPAKILNLLHRGRFRLSTLVLSLVIFEQCSYAAPTLDLWLGSLLIADKLLEDKPVKNSSLASLWPSVSLRFLNKTEIDLLTFFDFQLNIKVEEFKDFIRNRLDKSEPYLARTIENSEYLHWLQNESKEVRVKQENVPILANALEIPPDGLKTPTRRIPETPKGPMQLIGYSPRVRTSSTSESTGATSARSANPPFVRAQFMSPAPLKTSATLIDSNRTISPRPILTTPRANHLFPPKPFTAIPAPSRSSSIARSSAVKTPSFSRAASPMPFRVGPISNQYIKN